MGKLVLMKNKKNRLLDYITYMAKYYWEKLQLGKTLERTFVPIVLSAISSVLSFLVLYFCPKINKWAMVVAIILFSYSIFEYTFRYSFLRRHSRPYWIDVFIPWGIFSLLAYCGYFFIRPKIFNYIFLPLRACEMFSLRSWLSILLVLIFILLLMTLTRFLGKINRKKHRRGRH